MCMFKWGWQKFADKAISDSPKLLIHTIYFLCYTYITIFKPFFMLYILLFFMFSLPFSILTTFNSFSFILLHYWDGKILPTQTILPLSVWLLPHCYPSSNLVYFLIKQAQTFSKTCWLTYFFSIQEIPKSTTENFFFAPYVNS